MKLPTFLRITKSDYPKELQEVVDKLAYAFNTNFEVLFNVLNKNVSLRENFFGVVKDITVTVDATGTPTTTASFQVDNNSKVDGIIVISATNSKVYPTGSPFISFTQQGNTVLINNIAGLPQGNQFNLRVLTFYTS